MKELLTILAGLGIGIMFILISHFIVAALGCWLVPYVVNSWAVYFGWKIHLLWWQGGLIALIPVVGETMIPVAFWTWIFFLFI